MALDFRTVGATASSLLVIGALSTCSPASTAWANDYAKQLNVGTIAPASLTPPPPGVDASTPSETPDAPLPQVIEDHISPERVVPAIAEEVTQPRAKSLAALVDRHRTTQTAGREAECLAGAIYFESKGEPVDGQLAVAHTIINRAKSGRFASTNCGVVFQRGQFSFVRGGGFPPIARASHQWKTAVAVAHIAMNNLWTSSVSNALFFHARYVSPGWRLKRIAAVGNHVFYR